VVEVKERSVSMLGQRRVEIGNCVLRASCLAISICISASQGVSCKSSLIYCYTTPSSKLVPSMNASHVTCAIVNIGYPKLDSID
jgi:hypothetical protein